jgi:hypothetical protein
VAAHPILVLFLIWTFAFLILVSGIRCVAVIADGQIIYSAVLTFKAIVGELGALLPLSAATAMITSRPTASFEPSTFSAAPDRGIDRPGIDHAPNPGADLRCTCTRRCLQCSVQGSVQARCWFER